MSKVVPEENGAIEDKYAKVDLLNFGGSVKKTQSPKNRRHNGTMSPTRKLMGTLGGSFKRKTSEQKRQQRENGMLNRIVSSKEASPQLVSAVLRRQSRARSVSEDLSTVPRHDYFEDSEVVYDYDQIALTKLVQRHMDAGGVVQRWRKTHPLTILYHDGDPHKIPPPLLKLIKTGHSLDGSGMFSELMDILKKSKCIVLSFGKDWKIDFFPITEEDAFDIYGKIPCGMSFEDVCKERGETYTERINSVPGIDSLLADGLLYGVRRHAMLQTFTLEEIGVQRNHHLVLEASWGGPQFCLTNEDAYVVVNRSKGPYILPKINESHPVGYRRFFDFTQREQQALLDKAKASTKLTAKKWRRRGLACLLMYNSDVNLVPNSIWRTLLESVQSVGEHREDSIDDAKKNCGFESFDAVLLDFKNDGKPNFSVISARRVAIIFMDYFSGRLAFDDVIQSKGTQYRDLLFKFEGMKEIADRGLLIGAKSRRSISTFSGSELGMRNDTVDMVLETHSGVPHVVRKGEEIFVQCDDFDKDAIVLTAETVGNTSRPVAFETEEDFFKRQMDTDDGDATKVDESMLEHRIAEKLEGERLAFDCVRSLAMPGRERSGAHRFVTLVCVLLGVANVALQVKLAMMYVDKAVEDYYSVWIVTLTATWIFLPILIKSLFSCFFTSRCLLATDKLALLPLGINVKCAYEIFAGPRSIGHDERMVALATARVVDIFARCLPQAIMQTYILAHEAVVDAVDPFIISAVVVTACVTAGAKLAAVNMDFDCDPRHRKSDRTTFGYYPSGTGRHVVMFVLETVFCSAFVAIRALTVACVWATFGCVPIPTTLLFDFGLSLVSRIECGYLPYYVRAQPVFCNVASIFVVFASCEFAPLSILRSPYLIGGAGALSANAYVLAQSIGAGTLVYLLGDASVRVFVIVAAVVAFVLVSSFVLIVLAADTSFDVVLAWVRHRTPRSHFENYVWSNFSPNLFGPTVEDYRGWILEVWHPRNWHYQMVSEWVGYWMKVWTAREDVIPPWASEEWLHSIPPNIKEEGGFIMKARDREEETLKTQETLRALRLGCEQNSGDKMLSVLRFAQKWKKKALGPNLPPGMLLAMSMKRPTYDPLAALKSSLKTVAEKEKGGTAFVMEEVSDDDSVESIGLNLSENKEGDEPRGPDDEDEEGEASDGSVEL